MLQPSRINHPRRAAAGAGRPRHLFRLPLGSIVIVCFFLLLTTGCGIPKYAYLGAPQATPNTDLTRYDAYFQNAATNDPAIFQGYELYYKLYAATGTLDTEANQINDKNDLTEKKFTPLEQGLNVGGGADESTPLIRLTTDQKDDALTFTVDFGRDITDRTQLFNSTLSYTGTTLYLCRYVQQNRIDTSETDKAARSFQRDDFFADDGDIPAPSSYPGGTDGMLYLSLFVVSFGRNTDGTPVYSEPVSLGSFTFPVDALK